LRDRAGASCTKWCCDKRGPRAQQWFGLSDECTWLSFEQRGGVLWTDPPASAWTSVANCCSFARWLLPNRVPGLVQDEWQGKSGSTFKLRSRSTPPRAVLCKDARQMPAAVDPGCNENVHQMCEHPNYGRVLVATETMALWRRLGDGRALRTYAPLAMDQRIIRSGLCVGREEAQRFASGISPTTRLPARNNFRLACRPGAVRFLNEYIW
jgi:hypothetical protein